MQSMNNKTLSLQSLVHKKYCKITMRRSLLLWNILDLPQTYTIQFSFHGIKKYKNYHKLPHIILLYSNNNKYDYSPMLLNLFIKE